MDGAAGFTKLEAVALVALKAFIGQLNEGSGDEGFNALIQMSFNLAELFCEESEKRHRRGSE